MLLLSFGEVWSQSTLVYQGKVLNASGEPAVGAELRDEERFKVIALTDSLGEYYFESLSREITVYQIGYERVIVRDGKQRIVLKPTMNMLETFTISENKTASRLKNSTISLDIIRPELISNTSPTNIEESINRMSGVQIVDNQPSIRGGGGWSYGAGSRVQVLVDGLPMLSGDAGQPLWTFLPTEGIKNVEVLKGASSVIYGSSALNGVINLKTRSPFSDPFTQVTVSTGVYDLPKRESLRYNGESRNVVSNLTAYHSSHIKNTGINIGINVLEDEGYKMGDYDNRVRVNLGLQQRIGPKIRVGVNTSYQQGESGSFLLWESLDLGYTALDSNTTDNDVSRLSLDPFIHVFTGNIKHTFQARYLNIDNQVDNGDPTNDQSNTSNLLYREYQAKYSRKNTTLVGGIVSSSIATASPLFSGEQEASNRSIYAQLTQEISKLTLTAGGRYEQFTLNNREESKPVFRAGLNYELAKYTFLRASYGEGYRFPSIAESYVTTSVGPISVYPNNALNSESSSNIEIGLKQGFRLIKTEFMLDAAFFSMQYDNMMEFTFGQWGPITPPTFGAGFKTLNTGRSQVRGSEISLSFEKKSGKSSLQGFFGYTLVVTEALQPNKTIGEANGNNLTYINTSSNPSINALKYRPRDVVKGDFIFTRSRLTIGAGLSYQSAVENIDAAFVSQPFSIFVPGVQESIDQQLTRFFLINTRISYKIASAWKVNIILSNLLNREYAIRPADLGAPRTARFQLSYTLG